MTSETKVRKLNQQATELRQQGNYNGAIAVAEEAVELARRELNEQHPDYAISLNNLAELYREVGRYAEAESLF